MPFFLLPLGVVYYLAMARGQTAPVSVLQPDTAAARDGIANAVGWSRDIGYRGLVVLAFVLPFDMERRPILWTGYLTVTNLTVLLLAVAGVALVTVLSLAIDALRGSPDAAEYFSRRRVPLALVFAFLVSSAVSTVLAHVSAQGLSWFVGVVTGALLWLALPIWLANDTESKVHQLGMAIVGGAIAAGTVGLIEVLVGSPFDQRLLLFKFGPSTMGPFLRLSATFSSANVAAMYFELALAFAIAGLIGGLERRSECSGEGRQGGPGGHPQWDAPTAVPTGPMSLAIALGRRSRQWIAFAAWLAAVDVLLIALVLTYSRGAYLGLGAAGLAMAVAGWRRWRWRTAAAWRAPCVVAANLALVLVFFAVSTSSLQLLRLSTQNDRAWYQVAYVSTVPTTMAAGKERTVPVTVENRSPLTWNASSPLTYGLSYHWLYPSWKVLRFANNITWLSRDVRPGAREIVKARVKAPSAGGKYLLIWDMVWKGTTWFGPKTGDYAASPVRVFEPATRGGGSGSIGRLPSPDISDLPTAPALDRSQIWALAVRMIERRPLFGVGPQGVRMNFAEFAASDPATRSSKPPPHAHNLALEMLADWGLIGGVLFASLLAVLWWPLLRRVVRGEVGSSWELAVIGAAAALLGHELVDFFLTKQAIFVIFWLLCGLAATMQSSGRTEHAG